MKKTRDYYTLCIQEDGHWGPQFGDYDRKVVEQERQDSYKGKTWKIVKTGETQAQIDAAVSALNIPF